MTGCELYDRLMDKPPPLTDKEADFLSGEHLDDCQRCVNKYELNEEPPPEFYEKLLKEKTKKERKSIKSRAANWLLSKYRSLIGG